MFRVFGQTDRRGKVAGPIGEGGVVDERTAYSDSSRRPEQLSYIKLFHPSYELFTSNFQRFKHYSKN